MTPLPDASPAVPGTIDVQVEIRNDGTGTASGFDVGLYYDLAAAPTAGDPADEAKPVATLAPLGTKTLTFTGVSNDVPGIWQMYALVDSDGVVDESDEANNDEGPVEITWGTGVVVLEPNGGESWECDTTYSIGWSSYGAVDWTEVKIEYSVDDGGNWEMVQDPAADVGSYAWTVPLADSTNCLVRVTTISGSPDYSDVSDDTFTIRPSATTKPDLVVVSVAPSSYMPATGQVITIDVAVRNAGTAPISFFYVDLFFDRTPAPSVGDDGDLSDSVTAILQPGMETTVRFEDVTSAVNAAWQTYAIVDTQEYVTEGNEDNNVTDKPVNIGWNEPVDWLDITSPNGGEKLEQGELYAIAWTWRSGALVRLEVSTDGGITWQDIAANEANDGSYEWLVNAPTSTDCRIRVSSFSGDVTDVSDGVFAIGPEGANALLYVGEGCRAGAPGESARGAALWVACLAALWVIARRRPRSGLTTP